MSSLSWPRTCLQRIREQASQLAQGKHPMVKGGGRLELLRVGYRPKAPPHLPDVHILYTVIGSSTHQPARLRADPGPWGRLGSRLGLPQSYGPLRELRILVGILGLASRGARLPANPLSPLDMAVWREPGDLWVQVGKQDTGKAPGVTVAAFPTNRSCSGPASPWSPGTGTPEASSVSENFPVHPEWTPIRENRYPSYRNGEMELIRLPVPCTHLSISLDPNLGTSNSRTEPHTQYAGYSQAAPSRFVPETLGPPHPIFLAGTGMVAVTTGQQRPGLQTSEMGTCDGFPQWRRKPNHEGTEHKTGPSSPASPGELHFSAPLSFCHMPSP